MMILLVASVLTAAAPVAARPPPPVDAARVARGSPGDTRISEARSSATKAMQKLNFPAACRALNQALGHPSVARVSAYKKKSLTSDVDRCLVLAEHHAKALDGDLAATRVVARSALKYDRAVKKEALRLLIGNDKAFAERANRLFPVQARLKVKDASAADSDRLTASFNKHMKSEWQAWGILASPGASAFEATVTIEKVDVGNNPLLRGRALGPYDLTLQGAWTPDGGATPLPLDGTIRVLSIGQDHLLGSPDLARRFMEAWVAFELAAAAGEPKALIGPRPKLPPAFGKRLPGHR